jgi:hypothetical protein
MSDQEAAHAGCPNGGECDGGGWVPRAEYLVGDPGGGAEAWWAPCEDCNAEGVRVPDGPDSEPFWALPEPPDQEAAHLEYTQLKAHVRELEAVLRKLVEIEPVFRNSHGYWACLRCEMLLRITDGNPVGFRHAPDCPVTVARALLALPQKP